MHRSGSVSPRTQSHGRREWARTLLLALSILTIVASYMMVKAVRDAVFLARFGTTEQAFLFIGLAASAGLFAAIGTRLSRGTGGPGVIVGTHATVAASLLALWPALEAHVAGMPWVLYVWSSFFGLFVIANFWLLANQLYDTRTAKRVFPILGAGAITGGIVGGWTAQLATRIGAVDLLPIIAGGFLLSAALAVAAWRFRDPAAPTLARTAATPLVHATFGEGFRLVRRHRYLLFVASLLLLATVTTTLIELEVKGVAKEHFGSDRDLMAAFFGRLIRTLSIVSLIVQLLVTPTFLRRFGVGRALLVLPSALALGALAIVFHAALGIPAIAAVAVAKIGDGGLRFSLDKAAMELLYMPVPTPVKAKAKPVIDTVADRAGTAATGVLWLIVTFVSGAAISELIVIVSTLTLGLITVWIYLIFRTRAEYVQQFRVALPGPAPESHAIPVDLRNRRERDALRRALSAPDERAVRLALRALAASSEPPPAWRELRQLAGHPSPDIRARAFDLLADAGDPALYLAARRATADPNVEVRAAAVRYLAMTTLHGVDDLLDHPDPRTRLSAVAYLAQQGPLEAARASGHIAELLAGPLGQDPGFRYEIAAAIGALPTSEARPHLAKLLFDQDPRVAWVAGRSAARVGDDTHLRALVEALGEAPPRREAARAALRGLGAFAVGVLAEALVDERLPARVRRAIPPLLAAAGTQTAADALVGALGLTDERTRGRAVGALSRLLRQHRIQIDRARLETAVREEAHRYARHLAALRQAAAGSPEESRPGAALLRRALGEKVDQDLERIFRLLRLAYPEKEVLAAYYGLRAEDAGLRASALEFLDGVLENPLKRELLSLLESDGTATASGLHRLHRRRPEIPSRVETLRALAADPDPWLRALAVYGIGEARIAELADVVLAAAHDEDPRVREAAWLASRRMPPGVLAHSDAHPGR